MEELADITEATGEDHDNIEAQARTRLVTTSEGNAVVSVPVTLPVGSLIAGTAFNVITPDQLPHFKQMLCVDNNTFIGGTVVGDVTTGDLKTIVIQQQQTTSTAPTNHANQHHHQHQHQHQQHQHHHHRHHHQDSLQIANSHHQHQSTLNGGATGGGLVNNSNTANDAQTNGGSGGGNNSNNSQESTIKYENSVVQIASATNSTASSSATSTGGQHQSNMTNNLNWSDAVNLEVFPVRCKATTAELYKSKLGSGGRGRCIKYKEQWYTPSEFENVCGRGSSKDWKRSIRYGGRSLQALIDEGILTPHATSCTCQACCDDETTASGPVRLFTPYKRRKRNQGDETILANGNQVPNKKKRNDMSIKPDEILVASDPNIVTKVESWTTLSDIEASTEFLDPITSNYFDSNQFLKRLDTICSTMAKATSDFKRLFQELKEHMTNENRKIEQLQRERDAALIAARVHADADENNIVNQLNGAELVATKKCANCNREALAECSLCRRTPYCSIFCQRKDWNAHQVECRSDPNETTQQIMLLVDDQA